MKTITVKITDSSYLHRQMATKLQQIAGKYTCDVDVIVTTGGFTKANAKSLINLMSAYAKIKIPCKINVVTSS
ncbi:MAG: HPr family phosphocarrier protein [Mycoplasmoidaceae bacterium]|nr:HPr family phosphocarrier protein [Mycoplasmoidaceae bacterium]